MNAPLAIPKYVPIPNAKGCREKQRKNAAKFRLLLIDLITDNGPMGAARLAEMSGAKMTTVRDHLDNLMAKGLLLSEKVKGRNHPTGGATCLYHLAGDDDTAPSFAAKQRTVTKYPLNHVRDPLHTFLFGPAKQQG